MRTYVVDAQYSTVLVSARSTMGPIVFEGRGLEGTIRAEVAGDRVQVQPAPTAALEVDLRSLRSGNELYDAELRRRLDLPRFPTCRLELTDASELGEHRFSVTGALVMQERRRHLMGTVQAELASADRLTVVGEHVIDIRDFKIPSPQLLMMRIYPEVRVQLFLDSRTGIDEESEETP